MATRCPTFQAFIFFAGLILPALPAWPGLAAGPPAPPEASGGAPIPANGSPGEAEPLPPSAGGEGGTPGREPAPEGVTFPEAVARALDRNPMLAAAAHSRAAAREAAAAARSRYLPGVVFEERFLRTDLPAEAFALKLNQSRFAASDFAIPTLNDPAATNDFTTALTIEQPILAPKAWLEARMAGRESEAAGLELGRAREETVYRVLGAYLDVLSAKERVRVAGQGAADAREHLRIAEAAERAGMGLLSDVLRARVFLARAESGKVTAESRLSVARAALALAMGERTGAGVDAAVPVPDLPPPGSLEERIAAAAGRSDLMAVAARAANAETGVALEKSGYLPTIGAFGGWQANAEESPFSPDNHSWKVGVGLRWTLFDGLGREAAVGKAAAVRSRARELRRAAGDQAAFEVTRAHLAVGESERRRAIARAALAEAEEGLRLVKARYENQRARMIDLLDAQTALDAARADLVVAENDLVQARAGLEHASGTLLSWATPGMRPETRREDGR